MPALLVHQVVPTNEGMDKDNVKCPLLFHPEGIKIFCMKTNSKLLQLMH